MDLDRLRYFCAIAEAGSVRRAAEILRLSSPALSKAIRILEAESGHRLMIAAGRGIAITDEGRLFAARAREILREVEALRGGGLRPVDAARPVRIGSFEVFSTYFLGPLARRELKGQPLLIHELSAGLLERALIAREVDIGITYVPVPSSEIAHMEVRKIEMGIYARKELLRQPMIERLPFAVPVTPISGSPDRVRGSDGWPDDAAPRRIRYQVTLMESAIELCRQGLAAAYLPRFVARLHNERVKEELRLSLLDPARLVSGRGRAAGRLGRQPVYLLRRKTDFESAAFRSVAAALRQVCHE